MVTFPGSRTMVLEIPAQDIEMQPETAIEFPAPVLDQPGRGHDKNTLYVFARDQLADQHPCFDGLSKADLISDKHSAGRLIDQIMNHENLVRKQIHPA